MIAYLIQQYSINNPNHYAKKLFKIHIFHVYQSYSENYLFLSDLST